MQENNLEEDDYLEPLDVAVINRDFKMIDILCRDKRITEGTSLPGALTLSYFDKDEEMFQYLSAIPTEAKESNSQALQYSIPAGEYEYTKILLRYFRPGNEIWRSNGNILVIKACEIGRVDILQLLMESFPFNLGLKNNAPLRIAAKNGYIDLLKFILNSGDPTVNPAAKNSEALRLACKNGYLKTVKILLSYKNIDLTINDNTCIIWASGNGHLKVVKYLLKFSGVDITAQDNKAYRFVRKNGHKNIVKYINSL